MALQFVWRSRYFYGLLWLFSLVLMPTGIALANGTSHDPVLGDEFATAFLLLCAASYLAVFVAAIWVYNDANERGTSGCLWVLIVFWLGILGLVIYLVVRPKSRLHPCINCGYERSTDQPFCPNCGHSFYPMYEKQKF